VDLDARGARTSEGWIFRSRAPSVSRETEISTPQDMLGAQAQRTSGVQTTRVSSRTLAFDLARAPANHAKPCSLLLSLPLTPAGCSKTLTSPPRERPRSRPSLLLLCQNLVSPAGRLRHVLVPQGLRLVHAVHGLRVDPGPVLEATDGVLEALPVGLVAEVHLREDLLQTVGQPRDSDLGRVMPPTKAA